MDKVFTIKGHKRTLTLTPGSRYGFSRKVDAQKEARYRRGRYAYVKKQGGEVPPVRITKVKDITGVRYYVWD